MINYRCKIFYPLKIALFKKIFQEEDFTLEEIQRIIGLLGLSNDEVDAIFFK